MAKKRNKHSNGKEPVRMSLDRFMREKARSFPVDECYRSVGMEENGMCQVIVTRLRSNGNRIVGCFLIDAYCLGVKDAFYNPSLPADDYSRMIDDLSARFGIEKLTYEQAHNIIYGAIDYADEIGVRPCPEFGVARYVLEDDTDDIPLIEYQFGHDGKHLLVIGPEGKELAMLPHLQGKLGTDFDVVSHVDFNHVADNPDETPYDDATSQHIDPGDASTEE